MTHLLRVTLLGFALACAGLLAGCDTMAKIQLTKTQYAVIEPDEKMLADCPQADPPEEGAYVAATPKQREAMLVALSLEQMDIIAKCNNQWGTLREWIAKNRKTYSEKK